MAIFPASGFPAFLAASMPLSTVTDRRGECIYAACPHYRICFIERAIRRARHASIVVANHALVIAQASAATGWATDETTDTPHRTAPALCLRRRPSSVRRRRQRLRRLAVGPRDGRAAPLDPRARRAAPAPACAGWKNG